MQVEGPRTVTYNGGGTIDVCDYFRDLGIICVGISTTRVLSVEFITKNQYSLSNAMLKGYCVIVVIVGGVAINRSFVIGRFLEWVVAPVCL
jgi:hypothetical protein